MESANATSRKPIKESGSNSFFTVWALIPLVLALVPVYRTYQSGDPFTFIIPNALLFTSFRAQAREKWYKYIKIDTSVERTPQHVPVIEAAEYTFEKLREATDDFRYPAIVRGLFLNSPATEKWNQPGYLASKIGQFNIPVVTNARLSQNSSQEERGLMTFGQAYEDILGQSDSAVYLFFPVKSRFSYNHSNIGALEELGKRVNQLVLEDLEVNTRIWNGFGTESHGNYFGSQFIIGNGMGSLDDTTGTGWHCAPGNNWFVQVYGRKRWYFMDPKYSALMHPLRGGKVNMMTGHKNMRFLQKHLPIRFADVQAGDLLYNPDWEWHTIRNYEGLSFGVPIREMNITLSFRNNMQYTSIVMMNKLLEKFGLDIGGYSD